MHTRPGILQRQHCISKALGRTSGTYGTKNGTMEAIAARNEKCTTCLTGSICTWDGGAVLDHNDQDEERDFWDPVMHIRGVCLRR
jgi:hypothetical protein